MKITTIPSMTMILLLSPFVSCSVTNLCSVLSSLASSPPTRLLSGRQYSPLPTSHTACAGWLLAEYPIIYSVLLQRKFDPLFDYSCV
ncbi:hypothetical protein DTO271D3_4099 [Paecilomyces variotii]|nr:hypothetical protein DTO169C6_2706 [Paecilomyces variotii]KAJ9315526.1 hypothetical protein DTO271D3_4099 [Paecilomyces variotii]